MDSIKNYNSLIRISVQTISILKNSNYEIKESWIKDCQNDIKFYKEMKQIEQLKKIKELL